MGMRVRAEESGESGRDGERENKNSAAVSQNQHKMEVVGAVCDRKLKATEKIYELICIGGLSIHPSLPLLSKPHHSLSPP
jgi:hypothetical protein